MIQNIFLNQAMLSSGNRAQARTGWACEALRKLWVAGLGRDIELAKMTPGSVFAMARSSGMGRQSLVPICRLLESKCLPNASRVAALGLGAQEHAYVDVEPRVALPLSRRGIRGADHQRDALEMWGSSPNSLWHGCFNHGS